MIERWGAVVVRRAVAILLIGLGISAAAMVAGIGLEDKLSIGGFDDPQSEATQELTLERETFGNQSIDAIAIYSSDDLVASDPEFKAQLDDTLAQIPPDKVSSVISWYDTQDPSMLSHDEHAVSVFISLAGETQNDFGRAFDDIEPVLEDSELDTDVAGPYAVYTDVNEETKKDLAKAELISLPFVLILSLIIFRSLTAALMPVLVGAVAVMGARAVIAGLNEITEVSIFAPNIITLIGLGLAIDYALFVVSRFREEIALSPDDVDRALVTTMATAGRTVLFSALTVAAAMSSLLVFPQAFLKSIGYGGIAAVVIAMIAALTVLPAALALLGRRIDSLRVPFLNRATAVDSAHGAWARLAHAVMRRPLLVAVGIIAVLLLIASPFLGAKWGSVDYRVLPSDTPAHIAADKLNTDFGPERSTANVLLTDADEQSVAAYRTALEAVPGVVDVRPVEQKDGTFLLRAAWEGNSQTEHSQDMVKALRDVDAPDGSKAWIGGLTADTVDLTESISRHLPWMGLIVVGVMLLLLFIAFGSVVLPLKAVVMNFFSITASFGVVTWIFSDGHLQGVLGFESSGFLDLTNPIVMLAVLFGLSMDYEVFLLSRVKEEYDRTHDNDLAVATGIQKTGRIITSAALLLAVVIGAFSLSGVVFMKLLGIGMLVALLVDATIVRALLVPATMKMLGDRNWWAPAPLARWYDRYGFKEIQAPTEPPERSEVPVA
jgi:trehalose monomycolate/heme transporter